MTAVGDFKITRAEKSKLNSISLENIPFGKYFTDHMLEVDYENGEWQTTEIKPYMPLLFEPSLAALHYGQAIFEGIKAYKNQDGEAQLFRPFENLKRFNISAERMEMPVIPEDIFIEGMKQLIRLDADWIPNKPYHSLYVRPFMFSTDEMIGVKPSNKYKFMIILSPTGPYYNTPMRIYVEEKYVRAVKGGAGYAKNAGNYGAAMYPSAEAKRKGYDQVLWTDAFTHKYVQECGTMNIFFLIGNTAITPGLESGTILAGVTRDSVIQLLKDLGFSVEERNLSIDEITEAYKAGTLKEIFGTGTAATISMIRELCYQDLPMHFDVDTWSVAPKIKELMSGIKEGRIEDKYGWMVKV
ncbi:MAG: branched-chain amino acid aminotransferase [Bacteroidota bacterium]|nr:branched-chain amino acid aminotransferase [Bacteroidota bacterium]